MAKGLDFTEVQERESVKSINRHGTFEEDTNDPLKIKGALDILAENVHESVHIFLLKHWILLGTVILINRDTYSVL